MTTLAARPVGDPDQLALIGDDLTPLGKPFADSFRNACRQDADAHDGWVHPNRVSKLLRADLGDFSARDARRFSALWAPAAGPKGYLDKTGCRAQIDGEVSKGNGNKDVLLRRWRGWTA